MSYRSDARKTLRDEEEEEDGDDDDDFGGDDDAVNVGTFIFENNRKLSAVQ